VWVVEDNQRIRGLIVQRGAHASVIKYTLYGTVYEVAVDNDEFEYIGEEEIDDDPEG
jgi:hypothetical protein